MPHAVQTLPARDDRRAPSERMVVTDPDDVEGAAHDLAAGGVVGQAFANFYVITSRADRRRVASVNVMKGRPPGQVGSITTAPSRIPDVWDWTKLPPRLSRRAVLGVVDTFYGLGPFGFRGPAAAHIPDHLTYPDAGVRTAQVIAPGYACPSNHFLVSAIEAADDDLLYITSANRSRHLTGADDTPAHWRADGLRAEFGHVPGFEILEHPDEAAARARYPGYLPMSTTLLGFHKLGDEPGDHRPQLVLERHGSMAADDVRTVLDSLGFGMVVSPNAQRRLLLRDYSA
jgi:hypothetical protein